jgi:hypothetical protein
VCHTFWVERGCMYAVVCSCTSTYICVGDVDVGVDACWMCFVCAWPLCTLFV